MVLLLGRDRLLILLWLGGWLLLRVPGLRDRLLIWLLSRRRGRGRWLWLSGAGLWRALPRLVCVGLGSHRLARNDVVPLAVAGGTARGPRLAVV